MVYWATFAPRRPRGWVVLPAKPQAVPVELHISTVEPFSPTSCEYIGV
jgi:hypothetical protein